MSDPARTCQLRLALCLAPPHTRRQAWRSRQRTWRLAATSAMASEAQAVEKHRARNTMVTLWYRGRALFAAGRGSSCCGMAAAAGCARHSDCGAAAGALSCGAATASPTTRRPAAALLQGCRPAQQAHLCLVRSAMPTTRHPGGEQALPAWQLASLLQNAAPMALLMLDVLGHSCPVDALRDDDAVAATVAWLEDTKVRALPPDDRGPLRDVTSPGWGAAFTQVCVPAVPGAGGARLTRVCPPPPPPGEQYLAATGCPLPPQPRLPPLLWLLSQAVALEYRDAGASLAWAHTPKQSTVEQPLPSCVPCHLTQPGGLPSWPTHPSSGCRRRRPRRE